MATNNFDPDKRLEDVTEKGDQIYDEYTKGMESAITQNTNNMNAALDQIGVDENGNVKEGSATDKLMDAQNKNTDFAIEQIEQQKGQAEKDYTKEQAGAYADYQKQIDPYGVQAEQTAASGLSNSGYADSLKTKAYVAYQNRVAVNRESYQRIVQDFNNQITQARLQNNSALAEIYANAMAQRLQIITEFNVRGTELYTQMVQGSASLKQQNLSNYMSVYNQLVSEKQFNEQMAFQREQFEYQKSQDAAKSDTIKKSSGGGGGSRSSNVAKIDAALTGKVAKKSDTSDDVDAETYINALIASGATKDKVSNEIALALREGAIDTKTAAQLRNKFTPRGVQY